MKAERYRSPWYLNNDGYRTCKVEYADGTRATVYEHREIAARALGRRLEKGEHVHHRDGSRTNNAETNLEVLSASKHSAYHATGRPSPLKGVELGWQHGTIYAWMKKRCECSECSAAKRAWLDERNTTRRSGSARGHYQKNPDHGTTARYYRGCRCAFCKGSARGSRAGETAGSVTSAPESMLKITLAWWNGSHGRSKPGCPSGRTGSTPVARTAT